jgi:hypothetical protein
MRIEKSRKDRGLGNSPVQHGLNVPANARIHYPVSHPTPARDAPTTSPSGQNTPTQAL